MALLVAFAALAACAGPGEALVEVARGVLAEDYQATALQLGDELRQAGVEVRSTHCYARRLEPLPLPGGRVPHQPIMLYGYQIPAADLGTAKELGFRERSSIAGFASEPARCEAARAR